MSKRGQKGFIDLGNLEINCDIDKIRALVD